MPTTPSPADPDRRARRRILGWGCLALGVVAAAGAIEGIPRAERDLERRVEHRLADRGIPGVRATFSGQDGTLRCDEPLSNPADAERIAERLWGVRIAEVDRSCTSRTGAASDSPTTSVAAAEVNETTEPATTEPTTTEPPETTEPATTEPAETTEPPTTEAAVAVVGDVVVELVDGRLLLTGTVADEAARAALLDAAAAVVDPANIDDQLVVAGSTGADDAGATADDLADLASLVRTVPPNLVSGTLTRTGDGSLSLEGVYADDDARDAAQAAADAAGAEASLTERAEATATDAARLTEELNAFVAANPILFQPNSATLTAEAGAVVDQVAAIANRYSGVAIAIIGHTDSDGDAGRNLTLSSNRANTVRDALVAREVTATLTTEGRGETEPVVVGGAEDKTASRRVVFEISAV